MDEIDALNDPFGFPYGTFERLRLRHRQRSGELRRQRIRRAAFVMAMLVAYPLSAGPAYLLQQSGHIQGEFFQRAYAPLLAVDWEYFQSAVIGSR